LYFVHFTFLFNIRKSSAALSLFFALRPRPLFRGGQAIGKQKKLPTDSSNAKQNEFICERTGPSGKEGHWSFWGELPPPAAFSKNRLVEVVCLDPGAVNVASD